VRKHFIVVADGRLDEDGRPVTVLAKKTPFTWSEEREVLRHLDENPDLYPLYTPTLFASLTGDEAQGLTSEDEPWINDLRRERRAAGEAVAPFQRLILLPPQRSKTGFVGDPGLNERAALGDVRFSPRREFIRNYPFNIAPVNDNAPFFFFTFKTGDAVRNVLHASGRGMDWKNNLGVVVLGIVLVISLLAVLAFLIGPLALHGEKPPSFAPPPQQAKTGLAGSPVSRRMRYPLVSLLYFIALGLGYILVEIALIQRFVLFLGHPTYALTVVVFLMLLASGAGSASSRRLLARTAQVRPVLAVVGLLVLAYIFALPRALGTLVGLPFPAKLVISGVLLAPLGFAMGMPFPTGLRQIATQTMPATSLQRAPASAIEWAWAMNAASSVLGSVAAVMVAIQFGLNVALAGGAAAYLAAILLTFTWRDSLG